MGSGEEAGSVLQRCTAGDPDRDLRHGCPFAGARSRPGGPLGAQGERPRRRRRRRPADLGDPGPGASRRASHADRRDRGPGHRAGAHAGVPGADPPEHRSLRPTRRRRGGGADQHDPLPALRRSRPPDRPEPELADVRIPGPDLGTAAGRQAPEDPRAGGLGGDHRGRRLHRRLRARAAPSSRPCWRRADSMSSCSRRPATTTNPTSPSSSSRPTRRCSGGAARRRRPTATSAWSPGPPWAAARRSTGRTACAHDRGSVSSGPSTAWRASTARSSTATSTRSGTGSPRTTPAAT